MDKMQNWKMKNINMKKKNGREPLTPVRNCGGSWYDDSDHFLRILWNRARVEMWIVLLLCLWIFWCRFLMQCLSSFNSSASATNSSPVQPLLTIQRISSKHTLKDFWAELMEACLCLLWNLYEKKLCSNEYYFLTEWSVILSALKSFHHLLMNLECFVNDNNNSSFLATIVHLILIGLKESKSLLFFFWPLFRRIHLFRIDSGVDMSWCSQAFVQTTPGLLSGVKKCCKLLIVSCAVLFLHCLRCIHGVAKTCTTTSYRWCNCDTFSSLRTVCSAVIVSPNCVACVSCLLGIQVSFCMELLKC